MKNNDANYGESEYDLLLKIIGMFFNKITITPQILSEVWSLSDKHITSKSIFGEYFLQAVESLKACHEEYVDHLRLLNNLGVLEVGFTDISLIEVARSNNFAILTDERLLYTKFGEHVPIIKFSNVIAREVLGVSI